MSNDSVSAAPGMPSSVSGRSSRPHNHGHDHGHGHHHDGGESPAFLMALTFTCAGCALLAWFASSRYPEYARPLYILAYLSGGWAPTKAVLHSALERRLDVN